MRALAVVLLLLTTGCTQMQRRHAFGASGVMAAVGGSFVAGHLANMNGRGTCDAPYGTQCPELWDTTGATVAVEASAIVVGAASILYWVDGCLWGPDCQH